MKGTNVDELKKLVTAANSWRNQGLALTPTPIDLTQINAIIDGEPVVLAWNAEWNTWDVTAS
jgi:hypothetical protein